MDLIIKNIGFINKKKTILIIKKNGFNNQNIIIKKNKFNN